MQIPKSRKWSKPFWSIQVQEGTNVCVCVCVSCSLAHEKRCKDVKFPFVDQSTAALRRELVQLELSLNHRFAPELYLGVAHFEGTEETAIHMVKFGVEFEADKMLAQGKLHGHELAVFASELAQCYSAIERVPLDARRVLQDQLDNVNDLRSSPIGCDKDALLQIEQWIQAEHKRLKDVMKTRYAIDGHGDLHLTNLVTIDGRIRAFDCLEFRYNDKKFLLLVCIVLIFLSKSKTLRTVDPICDVAFLVMDLMSRHQDGLAHCFLSSFLEASGLSPL
jgi:aminoglycoside phosphotransferase family enzyme